MSKRFYGIIAVLAACSPTYNTTAEYFTETAGDAGEIDMIYKDSRFTPMLSGQSSLGPSFRHSDLAPSIYTLQFSFAGIGQNQVGVTNPVPPFDPARIPAARAVINWLVNGQPQRRVISIVSGAAISGVCSGVNVDIQDYNSIIGGLPANVPYSVQATLSAGPRATIEQPPTLVDLNAQRVTHAGGANPVVGFAVPQDSGVINAYIFIGPAPLATPVAATDVVATMTDTPSGGVVHAIFFPLSTGGWVPLVPGTGAITIQNKNATQDIDATIIWGIEG